MNIWIGRKYFLTSAARRHH